MQSVKRPKHLKILSVITIPVFLFAFYNPFLAEASLFVDLNPGVKDSQNSLTSNIVPSALILGEYSMVEKRGDSHTKVYIESAGERRILRFQETKDGRMLDIRYLYDDFYNSATLLFSSTSEGDPVNYSHYFRYAVGDSNNLALILEEGWVKDNAITPSRFYDYYENNVQVRFFDREGKLLRIDSSDGFKTHFIYSRSGKLLTIKETGPLGSITFYDQLFAEARELEPYNLLFTVDSSLYVLPNKRLQEKRLSSTVFKNPSLDFGLNSHLKDNLIFGGQGRFLEWLVAAHPLRAGPKSRGGDLK